MDRFLLKRKRADAFEEIKDNEEANSATNTETPKKKRRVDIIEPLSGSEFEPESDEEEDDESEYDPDQENKNTSNKNKKTKKSSNSNNKSRNKSSADPKDAEIQRLRTALREMTGKYNKMKLENDKLKKQIKSTPAKSSNNKKIDLTKIKKKYLKKWATRLPKVAGMKKTKFVGFQKEIVIEEMGFDREEFDAIFGDKGYLVQPRPDNKPKSTVIIKQFEEWESISELFGEYGLTEIVTVSLWRSRNFSKSFYYGEGTAKITELNACYNKSRKVLQLKFQCERECGFFW